MAKIQVDTEYDYLRFDIYKVEVGVIWLEEENHEDIDCYNQVYDKQFGYYDENVAFELDYNRAIEFANNYVENGVNGTYAIVSKIDFDSRYYKLDMETTLRIVHTILGGSYIDEYIDLFGGKELYHNLDNIVYSVRKQKDKDHPYYMGKGNGNIIENFVKTKEELVVDFMFDNNYINGSEYDHWFEDGVIGIDHKIVLLYLALEEMRKLHLAVEEDRRINDYITSVLVKYENK